MTLVLLDSTPSGLLVHRSSALRAGAEAWLTRIARSHTPVLPEIIWFELRRELLRIGADESVQLLDGLRAQVRYAPVTTSVLLLASELWAQTRRQGRPTADDRALDIDVILAATAVELSSEASEVIVATSNVGHLAQFVDARPWQAITL